MKTDELGAQKYFSTFWSNHRMVHVAHIRFFFLFQLESGYLPPKSLPNVNHGVPASHKFLGIIRPPLKEIT
jgi:hypothetical protein